MKRARPEIKQTELKAGVDGMIDRSDSAWQWLYSRVAESTTTAVKDHREATLGSGWRALRMQRRKQRHFQKLIT